MSSQVISAVGGVLNDPGRPLKERFRALFTLKNLGGSEAIKQMTLTFGDPSALLKHEVAYCLGQMGDKEALDVLENVLKDKNREVIVTVIYFH